MDKKAYLDQIAVKGKAERRKETGNSIFSPFIIKLITIGAILIITLLICGNLLNTENTELNNAYRKLNIRLAQLTDDKNSPINTYENKIRVSELRTYTSNLRIVLKTQKADIGAAINATGIDLAATPSEITTAESTNITSYNLALEDAVLNGNLDKIYATETLYQISMLISLESSVRAQTDSEQLAQAIDNSIDDLMNIEELFQKYVDSH